VSRDPDAGAEEFIPQLTIEWSKFVRVEESRTTPLVEEVAELAINCE
jgi:hypothetical protein